jgi:hypothetical protein
LARLLRLAAALGVEVLGQVVEAGRHLRMLAQGLLGDAQRLHVERLGLGVAALLVIDRGQVVETGHGKRVGLAERLSDDAQRPLVQRLGLAIAIQLEIEPADVVEALGDRGMLGPGPAAAVRPWATRRNARSLRLAATLG